VRAAPVLLELCFEVETHRLPEPQRRMLFPDERSRFLRRIGWLRRSVARALVLDVLVGRRRVGLRLFGLFRLDLLRLLRGVVRSRRCDAARWTRHGIAAGERDEERKKVNHSATPSAPTIGAVSIDRNSVRTSATASGSSTTIATSRRKSRLIAANA